MPTTESHFFPVLPKPVFLLLLAVVLLRSSPLSALNLKDTLVISKSGSASHAEMLTRAAALADTDPKMAYFYAGKALHAAKQTENAELICESYLALSKTGMAKSAYIEAYLMADSAISWMGQTGKPALEVSCLLQAAIVSRHLGNHIEALGHVLLALETAGKNSLATDLPRLHKEAGNIYNLLEKFPEALSHYRQALGMMQAQGSMEMSAILYNNIGWLYFQQKDYQRALENYHYSLENYLKYPADTSGIHFTYQNLGDVFAERGDFNQALHYHHKALSIREELGHYRGLSASLLGLGRVYAKQQRFADAQRYYGKALQLARDNNLNDHVIRVYELLSDLNSQQGRHLEALQAHKKASFLKDSLQDSQRNQIMAELEIKYKLEQQKLANERLENDNQIQRLESSRARTAFVFSLGMLLLLASLFLVYAYKNRHIRQLNLALEDKVAERTRQLEANQLELESQNQALIKTNSELDRFVYSTSHDLRSPIASALGLVWLLKNAKTPPELAKGIDLMEKSLNKLDHFIGEILDYSRNKRLDTSLELTDLNALAENVCGQYLFEFETKRIEKIIEVPPGTVFLTDSRRLKVILGNLVSNAIRYADTRGRRAPFVKISAATCPMGLVLAVEDNGQGIAPEHLGNIFQMFYRASENAQGSGLGLYILKECVDKLHGTVEVQSTPGEGSVFTIKLPKQPEAGPFAVQAVATA